MGRLRLLGYFRGRFWNGCFEDWGLWYAGGGKWVVNDLLSRVYVLLGETDMKYRSV